MAQLAQSHHLVWMTEAPSVGEKPGSHEQEVSGSFEEALESLRTQAAVKGFLLGQVLRHDKLVLATVAPGAVHRNDAMAH